MKIVVVIFALLLATATLAEEKKAKEDQKAESGNSFAEINKKLEELTKQGIEQNEERKAEIQKQKAETQKQKAENEELRKEVEDLRQAEAQLRLADAQRQKDFAALKTDNVKLREIDSVLRKADADLRQADAKILKTKEEEAEKKEIFRQRDVKRQEDVEGATRALILDEIAKDHKAHNFTKELKKLMREEIYAYQASGVQSIIPVGDGTKKWDSDGDSGFKVEGAFSTESGCAGYSASANRYNRPFPIMVWVEFPTTHVPSKFAFKRSGTLQTPKTWRFVGSKQEGCSHDSTWKPLCGDMVGDKLGNSDQEVQCEVPKYAREPFKCLGIRVYSNNYSDNAVCVIAMRFWENTPHLTSRA